MKNCWPGGRHWPTAECTTENSRRIQSGPAKAIIY